MYVCMYVIYVCLYVCVCVFSLGFELQTEDMMYHHPCFQAQNGQNVDFIARNSIVAPDINDKVNQWKAT